VKNHSADKETELPELELRNRPRSDRGRLHAIRLSVLSRGLLEALRRSGENLRTLRKMERQLRADLEPRGALESLLFDRFWASCLRLILAARLEQERLAPRACSSTSSISKPFLREGAVPILVVPSEQVDSTQVPDQPFQNDILSSLALLSRYDRAASREMYKALGSLLMMRNRPGSG
jgi:hypothetical protein